MCAKPTGFLEYDRRAPPKRAPAERLRDFAAVESRLPAAELLEQAARCMDCGIPFCHAFGCPLHNLVPDFNDMVSRGHWRKALDLLHAANNFPEFTGRICPAPCEAACTLSLNQEAVTIREIELQIVEHGWEAGWIRPVKAGRRSGRRVAAVGSGPAGLAAAQQLGRAGHDVTVFERADRPGGVLRYGIPDFKLEKWVLDRRLDQLRAEGVVFETGVDVGADVSLRYLRRSFDAVLFSGGARCPRDLDVPGRKLAGIHFAMPYLIQQNHRNAGDRIPAETAITAAGKHVAIIGGGDTGADCLGTALRQGAAQVVQLEILPKPPPTRSAATPWPLWPDQLRTSSSHEEGGTRRWAAATQRFLGRNGHVIALRAVAVDWARDADGRHSCTKRDGTEFRVRAELVLLAAGFTTDGNREALARFGLSAREDGRAARNEDDGTLVPGIFVAGDLAHGASLVVRAMLDGRRAAAAIDRYLSEAEPPPADAP